MERLQQANTSALEDTDEEIKTWEKFRSDYEKLRKRLQTLPDTLTQDVMVPFGSQAFMPGKLVHTNEIFVLLGDDWFAQRSAKQAVEIVNRRLKSVEETITRLKQQKRLLSDRRDFSTQLFHGEKSGDFFEIQEEYDEEKEKLWKERHKRNVKEHRHKTRLSHTQPNTTTPDSVANQHPMHVSHDDQLWRRLDELEKVECSREEISRLSVEEVNIPEDETIDEKKPETFDQSKSVRWEDDGSNDSNSDDDWSNNNCIIFSHTNEPTNATTSSSQTSINSPADIYKNFYKPTSILKQSSRDSVDILPDQVIQVKEEITDQSVAFTGDISEHKDTQQKPPIIPDVSSKPKKMSKFKQERQKISRI